MNAYAILLRSINVGGKNTIPMAELRACLEAHGFQDVRTYIQSGNVVTRSDLDATTACRSIEALLTTTFTLDSQLVKVMALTREQLKAVVTKKPAGFGENPETYHSDVIFLMDIDIDQALTVFDPREGVDAIWQGEGVIYSQRLSSRRSQSRLAKIIGTKPYQSMTIRNWNTTTRLLSMLEEGSD